MSGTTSGPFDATIGSGPDTILLRVAEDAFKGDARFTVSIDGQQIDGEQTAFATHANGETQSLAVRGAFGAGAHSVSVDFLNDLYDASLSGDRNLYVADITSNGVTVPGAALFTDGPRVFQVPASTMVTDTASLNAAIDAAAATTSGNIAFSLGNDITITAALEAINLQPGVTLTIDGQGHVLSGAGSYRGLFAYAGTLTVQNLEIDNTLAQGGKGGGEGGGGGAGLGGGLFVAGTNAGLASGAAVTLSNVAFNGASAVGGAGSGGGGQFGGNLGPFGSYGGGGGLGGAGGSYSLNGGGGGGIGGAGGTATAGASGIVPGAAGGGSGAPPSNPTLGMAFPGGANGGGGGSSTDASFRAGGGGGVGGSAGSPITLSESAGGAGGFGGGGGGASTQGGNGGFGGGGGSQGSASGSGGNGGFGGGGASHSQSGGFGAGAGSLITDSNGFFNLYDGGGGLGAGGAVFVQAGGTLTIAGGQVAGGSAVGGKGGTGFMEAAPPAIRNGQGLGAGIFLQGDQTITFTETAGQATTVADTIADQTGSGGSGGNAGAGKVAVVGPGTVTLAAANTYAGGTSISSGTLELVTAGAAGSGTVAFTGDAAATLRFDAAALPASGTFANPITGFAGNHLLDLAGLAYGAGTTATIAGNLLTVSNGSASDQFTLSDVSYATPFQAKTTADGTGGTLVSAAPAGGADTLVLKLSEDAYNGDAQFTVSIDGTPLAGARTATASHAAGATQDFAFSGDFGPGAHIIGITFINDAYAGTDATDRNLYVDSVSYDGRASVPPNAALFFNGTAAFDIPAAPSATTLTLSLAEDSYQGDAQYSVAIDGQHVGTPGTVTASHALGQAQAVDILATLSAGVHDLALSFLNDAYAGTDATDRNLYLLGTEVNGASVPRASANFFTNGTEHFSIFVPQQSGV